MRPMADTGLYALYKLHLVDAALFEMKHRAAALDLGKAELAQAQQLAAELETVGGEAHRLAAELKDLELQNKSGEDKIKRLSGELYGGKVVNPREVQTVEQEIESTRRRIADNEERMLELYDLVPPAQKAARAIEDQIAALKKTAAEKRQRAVVAHAEIERSYKAKSAERAPATKAVPAPLLAQYERIRERLHGPAMATVTDIDRCEACGMLVPEKTRAYLKADRVVECESCHRILIRLVTA